MAASFVAAPRSAAQSAEASPILLDGFSSLGSTYISIASARASSPQEAEEKARGVAMHGLFTGLGKDGLFAEVFAASPPAGLSFKLIDSSKKGSSFKAIVRLEIDDESVRIVERGPYLAAAIGILDKAEAGSNEAEARQASAAAAETEADLGAALGQYGMAIDACLGALGLIDPVADPSIFSSKGKVAAPELKNALAAMLAEARAGVERVKKAEAELAADAASAAALNVAETALAAVADAQALLDEIAPVLADVGAQGEERLSPLRDRISMQRRSLSDSTAALERAQATLPEGKIDFANDKLDFARRRLSTADASLASAFRTVDREIRDPAVRRAARSQALRWAFLHEPREYLAIKAYLPFTLAAGQKGIESSPFDAAADFEGAFAMGRGGVWVRSQAKLENTDLEPGLAEGKELAINQSFDFGIWRKGLFFAGYSWDWLRNVDAKPFPKHGAVKLGLGGVYEHGVSAGRFNRADWLLGFSYELPYTMEEFRLWNVLNAGVDAQFRLGGIAILEASVSKRLDELNDIDFVSVLRWSLSLGLRLPPPFAFGAEYYGAYAQSMLPDGKLSDSSGVEEGRFRFFVQYSI
jgi:hypothetical protein